MGKTTISMAIFHGYVNLPEGKLYKHPIKPSFSHGSPNFQLRHPNTFSPLELSRPVLPCAALVGSRQIRRRRVAQRRGGGGAEAAVR